MTLVDKVNEDLKAAMRAKEEVRLASIRALRGEILKKAKSGADVEVTDDDVIAMTKSLIKQRQDSIAMFEKGNRQDLADNERAQMEILQGYLPAQLTEDEITALIQEVIAETGASSMKEMGLVMKNLQAKVKATGKDADGRAMAGAVKAALS